MVREHNEIIKLTLMMMNNEDNFKSLGLRNIFFIPKHSSYYIGHTIIVFFVSIGCLFIYAAFISKLLPDTNNSFLDSIKHDYYFCYLIPLSILPTYSVLYLNWLAMRHFEQN